jgi:multiple sugar transport system substrate-binding protein
MSKFQIITFAILILCIIAGVVAFATFKGTSSSTTIPAVTIWGTFPASTFNQYVGTVNNTLEQPITVTYVEKKSSTFSQEFIAALARGQGPDGILVTADMILPHIDKLTLVPYSALSQREFIDTFISGSKIYLYEQGILAMPIAVDPLVMYWNRDMFNAAGVATYPRFWDEFQGLNKKLTVKDANGNIRKSAIAMGDFSNMNNPREVFGSLLLQIGNPVISWNKNGEVASTIKISASASPSPALQFFGQFVDPSNDNYSWNRGLPDDKSAFLSGMLGTYFGFASELRDLKNKNPNLNFDVAALPQLRAGGQKATYGRIYGLSVVKSSANANAVFQIASILTRQTSISTLSGMMYLPPVRLDLISAGSTDPYISIFDQTILVAQTWMDADPTKSRDIMANMVQSYVSGQKSISQAIQNAGEQYDVMLSESRK